MGLRLAVRGDDAGSCESADRACEVAARRGILRNISVMVPGPSFRFAAPILRELENVDLGLHVVLNSEWDAVKWGPVLPADQVPSLVDERGMFTQNPHILHERGMDVAQALAEVEAQLAVGREAGLEFRYLDQHMGVGWVGGLNLELLKLAASEGLLWIDDLPHVVSLDEAVARREEDGVFRYVTHPGYDAPDMRAFHHAGLEDGQIARERDAERIALIAPQTLRWVADGMLHPVRFSEA